MRSAYDRLVAINEPGALNIIVFFTDGVPTAVTGKFPIRKVNDTRAGYSNYKGWDTTITYPSACTNTTSGGNLTSCDMQPSPCRDAQSDQYHRDNTGTKTAAGSYRPPTYPNWNPNWSPPATLDGAIAGGDLTPPTAGDTQGVFKLTGGSMSESTGRISGSGCDFSNNASRMRRDVAYIPSKDYYNSDISGGYKGGLPRFPSGHPYQGQIRPDSPKAITWSAVNATDSIGTAIRTDNSLKTIIFTIGLGDVDDELLRRLSNDPTSPIYDKNLPRLVRIREYSGGDERSVPSRRFRDPAHRQIIQGEGRSLLVSSPIE